MTEVIECLLCGAIIHKEENEIEAAECPNCGMLSGEHLDEEEEREEMDRFPLIINRPRAYVKTTN